jgi:hypothetical protein
VFEWQGKKWVVTWGLGCGNFVPNHSAMQSWGKNLKESNPTNQTTHIGIFLRMKIRQTSYEIPLNRKSPKYFKVFAYSKIHCFNTVVFQKPRWFHSIITRGTDLLSKNNGIAKKKSWRHLLDDINLCKVYVEMWYWLSIYALQAYNHLNPIINLKHKHLNLKNAALRHALSLLKPYHFFFVLCVKNI